jgi:drug/metabolite transporter (DMT)-like permease
MRMKFTPHTNAVLQALFVTLLWSTSWVLIKIGLVDIPALSFSGLRYSLAFLCLLPFALTPANRAAIRRLTGRQWGLLALLGLVYYTIVQGAQFVGLAYLPAATVSLLLNFSAILVALMSMAWLKEKPGLQDWVGILLTVAGSVLYFYPVDFPKEQVFGLVVVIVGVIANAAASVLGRYTNARTGIPVLLVTTISMGIGSGLLLLAGGVTQGFPVLGWNHWLIIAWLAVVNTAIAFNLWNHTLRTLPAVESSVINNTMLVQIPLLAWIFLGEALTVQEWVGMVVAGLGVLVVQVRRRK